MKNAVLSLFIILNLTQIDAQTFTKKQRMEASWDQGVPVLPDDESIMRMINNIGFNNLLKSGKTVDRREAKICREIGVAFYDRGMYDAADWYFERVKGYTEAVELEPEVVFEQPAEEELPEELAASLAADKKFLENLPKSYDKVSPSEMKRLANQIEGQLQKLITEKEKLVKNKVSQEVIDAKGSTIKTLEKEKEIIDLSIETGELKVETKGLRVDRETLKKYLKTFLLISGIVFLLLLAIIQRKTIKKKDFAILENLIDINKKNTYLEYAARLIRHDMHSGINTYMPRGLTSLEKRIPSENVETLKLESSLKMLKEGLSHTQRVYRSVYEFTNIIKKNVVLDKQKVDLTELINNYVSGTSYSNQVKVNDLVELEVNPTLFCNALDNLIKNGLVYNDSEEKSVLIYMEEDSIVVQDNGRGLSQEEFKRICSAHAKGEDAGLGINISLAIFNEHGFKLSCEKLENGTKIKIKVG